MALSFVSIQKWLWYAARVEKLLNFILARTSSSEPISPPCHINSGSSKFSLAQTCSTSEYPKPSLSRESCLPEGTGTSLTIISFQFCAPPSQDAWYHLQLSISILIRFLFPSCPHHCPGPVTMTQSRTRPCYTFYEEENPHFLKRHRSVVSA